MTSSNDSALPLRSFSHFCAGWYPPIWNSHATCGTSSKYWLGLMWTRRLSPLPLRERGLQRRPPLVPPLIQAYTKRHAPCALPDYTRRGRFRKNVGMGQCALFTSQNAASKRQHHKRETPRKDRRSFFSSSRRGLARRCRRTGCARMSLF